MHKRISVLFILLIFIQPLAYSQYPVVYNGLPSFNGEYHSPPNHIFEDNIYASNIKFKEAIDFNGATFNGEIALFNNTFFRRTDLNYSTFKKRVAFVQTNFIDNAFFVLSDFQYNTYFDGCNFLGTAVFSRSAFYNKIHISGVVFMSNAYFNKCTFFSDVDFSQSVFLQPVFFTGAKTTDSANLAFNAAILPDSMFFNNMPHLKGEIDLIDANFNDKENPTNLILYNTDLSHLKLDYIHFKACLIDSLTLENQTYRFTLENKENVFEQLLANFKTNGQTLSYELCDIDYQQLNWQNSWAAFLPCIPYYWNRFGYKKGLIFFWTFIFLALFTSINYKALDYLNENIYPMSMIPPSSGIRNPFRRFWYSFVYTSTIFFRLTLKIENINFQRILGTIYLITIYTLGIICLAYMAGYVLQK